MLKSFSKRCATTFSKQASLPKLPIPTLEESCERYLSSVQSILPSKEDFEMEKKLAKSFIQEAELLQHKLTQYADDEVSYISRFWEDMYMKGRWSLPVNSNPGSLTSNIAFDASVPWPGNNQKYTTQVSRAAQSVKATLDFLVQLEQETLEPDTFRSLPLDMSPYLLMFATCRVPMKNRDIWVRSPASTHICVLKGGEFFKVQVLDETTRKPYSAKTIAKLLNQVVKQSKEGMGVSGLASLTTLDRDTWAGLFTELKSSNVSSMNDITGALFHLALDDENLTDRNELVRSSLHGNGQNRWFDQSFTLMMDESGSFMCNFEHSWGDGLSIARLTKEIHEQISKWKESDFGEEQQQVLTPGKVKKIEFKSVTNNVIKARDDALKKYETLTRSQLGLESRVFAPFGTERLKALKASPDGAFQQALQLAYRRMTGKTVATYESCSTQTFLGGRTETIRSASPESFAFVSEVLDCLSLGDKERAKLLRKAISKHSALANEAASGKGFDRHFFALKRFAEKEKLTMPSLLAGKGYTLLEKNILSTSTVSGKFSEQSSFGPVSAEGLGVCYHFFPNQINFCVTSYSGDASEYASKVEVALFDVERFLSL